MILRKNISLNEEYLKKLEPLMQKHEGNLSAVIREIIDLADAAFQDPDSVKRLISGLKKEQNLTSSALSWALENLDGRLPDEETVYNIIGDDIFSISSLEKRLNDLAGEIYWGSSVKIISDDDRLPKNVTFSINGKNEKVSRFLAAVIAVFAAKKHTLGVSRIRSANNVLEMEMKKGEKDWAQKSITENLGYMEPAFSEIYKKPDFWNTLINLYAKMDYDVVAISGQLFNEILSEKPPTKINEYIERFCGRPINKIGFEEFLQTIKVLYQSTGLIENMEISKESLIIHHKLTEPVSIKKLANMFVELLRLNGHVYNYEFSENLIVLRIQSDIAKIFFRMLEDLETQKIPFPDYYSSLTKMLDLLKNMAYDEKLIKSFGYKFGEAMIKKYEKDKRIGKWEVGAFVQYLQEASGILKQNAKWELVSRNVIHGKIMTCQIVKSNDGINIPNCMFIKGLFDGSISHAFGENAAERIQSTHTEAAEIDKSCEIYLAF